MEVMEHMKEEVEEVFDGALHSRRSRRQENSDDFSTGSDISVESSELGGHPNGSFVGKKEGENGVAGSLGKNVYYDNNEGLAVACSLPETQTTFENLDVQKILSAVIGSQAVDDFKVENLEDETAKVQPLNNGVAENARGDMVEEIDEEVVELEFERAAEMVHSHNMYCPNCNSCITKVVLRRKRVSRARPAVTSPPQEPLDLFGCLSCFRFFIPSGNCLNSFDIFGKVRARKNALVPEQPPVETANTSSPDVPSDKGKIVDKQAECFNPLWIFGMGREDGNAQKDHQQPGKSDNSSSPNFMKDSGNFPIKQGNDQRQQVKEDKTREPNLSPEDQAPITTSMPVDQNGSLPTPKIKDNGVASDMIVNPIQHDKHFIPPSPGTYLPPSDVIIDFEDKPADAGLAQEAERTAGTQVSAHPNVTRPRVSSDPQSSKSLEILKSIVYGGLMELIASLSLVSSAAASDATTLNIIAMGVANLFGGLLIIFENLRGLKNDHPRESADRYQELLGRRENFVVHVVVVLLSFIVFGLIPPVTYGFSFHESDDKDMKLLAVAAASLLCVVILAIGKAYIGRPTGFSSYIKTILYYVTAAAMGSGVAFALGNLFKDLLQKYGWFDSTPAPANLFLFRTESTNPSLTSY